jgi:hypothetical protein
MLISCRVNQSFHIISNDSGGEVTPSVIRGKIDQYKPDFVVVDYLQLMSPNQKSDNENSSYEKPFS